VPALIRILEGPDAGMEVRVYAQEVRIGRGVGCTLVLRDEQFNGQLRVTFERNTYWVKNETDEVGYSKAKNSPPEEFPPNDKRIWYHEQTVQVTARTLLQLAIVTEDEGEDELAAAIVRRTQTPEDVRRKRNRLYLFVTLAAAPLAVFLFLQPADAPDTPAETPTSVARQFEDVSDGLRATERDPKYGRSATLAGTLLRNARLNEVSGRRERAYTEYQLARDELARALGDLPTSPPSGGGGPDDRIRVAHAFAAGRVVALTPPR
jgi:hypothetical protein